MKKIKYFLFILLCFMIIPSGFLFSGCSINLGDDPVGIVSIDKTSTNGLVDTYTITYTNGTSSTFTITNGKDGDDGKDGKDGTDGKNGQDGKDGANGKGIVDIQKTSTSGNLDTYTIIYSDNTTSTFTVSNGKDGKDGKDGEDGESLDIQDIYTTYKNLTEQEISFEEFLEIYLEVGVDDTTKVAAKCLQSCVIIKTNGFTGSGVVVKIDEDYTYILTNCHVLLNEAGTAINTSFTCLFYGVDEIQIPLTYVGCSKKYDLGVLKASNSALKSAGIITKAITFAEDYHVGNTAIAIGNALGEGLSVTRGIVSVKREDRTFSIANNNRTIPCMRIDTSIYHGNSGGGLFNTKGELIGITNGGQEEYEHMNFAIPVSVAKPISEKLIEESLNTVMLGVTVQESENIYRYYPSLGYGRQEEKIEITQIQDSGIASRTDLQVGDVIKSIIIDDKEYSIYVDYNIVDSLLNCREGSKLKLKILRINEEIITSETTITAEELIDIE